MRTAVLVAIGLLASILAGTWAQILEIAGIQVDIILLLIVSFALTDRTSMPMVFAACTGLVVDILYSTILGYTALAYTATAAAVFFAAQRAERINLAMVVAAGALAYCLKNVVIAITLRVLEVPEVDLATLFLRYILPGAGITALLIIPSYWLLSKLLRQPFMRARRKLADEF